jgi:hypothetical protein
MLRSKMNENPPTTQSLVATAMNSKLTDYWVYLNKSSTISTIIDPSHKLETFNENIDEIKEVFKSKYKTYLTTATPPPVISIEDESSCSSSRKYFRKKLKLSRNNNITDDTILDNYLNSPEEEVDPLVWYKAREADPKYNTLVFMAKDYLSIQATSVSSEQAFSIAKNTVNPTRNRLDPEKARASLCLKSWIDNGLISLQDI